MADMPDDVLRQLANRAAPVPLRCRHHPGIAWYANGAGKAAARRGVDRVALRRLGLASALG